LSSFPASAQIRELQVPPEHGTITEYGIWNTDNARNPLSVIRNPMHDRMVVYIQDAHDSLEAQENIAKLVEHFVQNHGVRTVFEEGYEGPVPTDDFFGFIEDPKLKQKTSHFFLDKLRLGGAEYAHINRITDKGIRNTDNERQDPRSAGVIRYFLSDIQRDVRNPLSGIHDPQEWQLIGADSLKLHRENIQAYGKSAQFRRENEKDLRVLEKKLNVLMNRYFSSEFKKWLKWKARYEAGKLSLGEYIKRTVSGLGIWDSGFVNIQSLVQLKRTQDKSLIKKIDARELLGEIEQLEQDFVNSSLRTNRDKKIFEYYQKIQLLQKLNEIKITEREYQMLRITDHGSRITKSNSAHGKKDSKLNAQRSGLRLTREIGEFISGELKKPLVLSKRWEQNIQEAVRFYELVKQRDQAISRALEEYFLETEENGLRITDYEKEKRFWYLLNAKGPLPLL